METRFNIMSYFKGSYGPEHDFNPIPIVICILLLTLYIYVRYKRECSDRKNRGGQDEEF